MPRATGAFRRGRSSRHRRGLAAELYHNAKPQEFPEGFASLQVIALALGMKKCDYVGDDRGVTVAVRIARDGGPR